MATRYSIPEHMRLQKEENIKMFPALSINLTQQQIDWQTPGNKITGLSKHQKAACFALAVEINWHPMYVAECCPTVRPSLLAKGDTSEWLLHCALWQAEHDLSVADLAAKYKAEFAQVADRIFEPLDVHSSGVIMSAHDNTRERYPCFPGVWR